MKRLLILFFLSVLFAGNSQSETKWELLYEYELNKGSIWCVDALDNIFISYKDKVRKYNNEGKLLYTQSQKSFGRIALIEPLNPLKVMAFSEEQQTVCFFDNTLTVIEDCIELSDLDIVNAITVSNSSQSDKIWVFDQSNSTLHLIDLTKKMQSQEVKNIAGLINAEEVKWVHEMENKLYLFDVKNGLFVFDLYGTLIDREKLDNLIDVQDLGTYLVFLFEDRLVFRDVTSNAFESMALPINGVQSFTFIGSRVYLQTVDKLSVFDLNF